MKKFPKTMTKSDFPEVWDYVARKNRRAKRCAVIEKITAVIGNTLFLVLAVFLCCGMLQWLESAVITAFLKGLPWNGMWQWFADWLADFGLPRKEQIIACVVLLYLIPFAVCAVPALLVRLCYYPRQQIPPQGTDVEQAEALLKLGKKTRFLARSYSANMATWTSILFLIIIGILVSMFVLQNHQHTQLIGSLSVGLMVGAFVLLFAYAFINYILLKFLKLLHLCLLPKRMMDVLTQYCEKCRAEAETETAIKETL